MKIGLSYDLKEKIKSGLECPEDALEEYDSPLTVNAIAEVLQRLGHDVVMLGGGEEFLDNIRKYKVDIVFNIAEGLGNYRSREAQVPAVLEMLDIPYVGSDPLCMALSLDKSLTKQLLQNAGIPTAPWLLLGSFADLERADWNSIRFPSFIKPLHEGSSKGVRLSSRVEDKGQAQTLVQKLWRDYCQPVMLEEFIPGDEITVGITGNNEPQILGIMRILPRKQKEDFIYSLEVKRDWENLVTYECPAQIRAQQLQQISTYSLQVFRILGCRDFARVDFKINRDGLPLFLEINPLAGLNPYSSDLPIMAGKLRMTYDELIEKIMNAALERYPKCVQI